MITTKHRYKLLTPSMRPQDPGQDGKNCTFQTLGHGGSEPDCMPQAIKFTDADGRWCIYVPTEVKGQIVQSHGFDYHDDGA